MTDAESSFEKIRRKMVTARIAFMGQLARFRSDELGQTVVEEEWSPLLIAYHLAISDGLALTQLRRVQEEDTPFTDTLSEAAPEATMSAELPTSLEAVLATMASRREDLLTYLANLPADAWERPLRHKEWGQLKFYQLANVLPIHDQQHTRQLMTIKEALDKQTS